MSLTAFEVAARAFEPDPPPRWASPGAMARELDPSTVQTPALELIDASLADVAAGELDRLMVFMPPQTGKSQRVSRRFPAWLLNRDPTLQIAIVSYQAEKAVRWGRQIRRDAEHHPELSIVLRADDRAAGRWQTEQGGGVICVGVGSGLTGSPVDCLIVDDPFAGRAEAESAVYRSRAWDWWENVGSTRLSPRGVAVLMMTRWHTDDLAGRLLAEESGEWRVLSIPAIAEDADDPLGRAPGVELVSAQGRPAGYFHKLQELRSPYVFRSVYQQRPTSAQGGIFARADWRYWRPQPVEMLGRPVLSLDSQSVALADCARFITIDLASSLRTSADFTVAAAWAIDVSGNLILLDRVRARVEQAGHFDLVTPLRQRWLGPYDVTYVESRMFGTTMVYAAGRAGLPLAELVADKDKLTRALPAADLARQHRVWLPADAPWLDEWLDEHADFPHAAFDDQVDVMAYAARVAVAHWLPQESSVAERARRSARSADPWGESTLDFMRADI